jgi:hypothetical protein
VASTPVRARVRGLAAKVPTTWILAGVAALLLAASALFGGLNDAPAEPIPELALGDVHHGSRIDLEVSRASLIDGFPDLFLEPAEGNRFLVIVGTATNVSTVPVRQTITNGGAPLPATVISPAGIDGIENTAPSSILVFSDATVATDLQPGVPVELAYLWEVPADALHDGDSLVLDFWDEEYDGEARIYFGARYRDPERDGTMTVAVQDVDLTGVDE